MDTAFQRLAIGKGELLRTGSDALLLPIGNRVASALAAAARLEQQGITAAVINPRFLKPLDSELITTWAAQTGRVVTIEDNSALGGFGSGVLQLLNEHGLHLPVKILGYGDTFIEHGPQTTLWNNAGIDTDGIVRSVLDLMRP